MLRYLLKCCSIMLLSLAVRPELNGRCYVLTEKHPWTALLGWLPPIYLIGLIRNIGEPWCTWDGGFASMSLPIPVHSRGDSSQDFEALKVLG